MSDATPEAPTADAAGAAPNTPAAEPVEQPTFTQADLDRILAERLERQKKKMLKEQQDAADAATTQQLEEAAEWQKLAEKRQTQLTERDGRIAELETRAALAEKYGTALDIYVSQLSEGLPESIITLLGSMDQAAKLEWLAANREQFVQNETPEQPEKRPSIPQTPKPRTDQPLTETERRKRAARTF